MNELALTSVETTLANSLLAMERMNTIKAEHQAKLLPVNAESEAIDANGERLNRTIKSTFQLAR